MTAKPRFLEAPPTWEEPAAGVLADHVEGFIGNIIESAAVWYALLYLVQIEGAEEYRFDFERVTENLSVAFLFYILHSTHKEFQNARTRYYIDGKRVEDYDDEVFTNHMIRQLQVRGVPDIYTNGGDGGLINANVTHPRQSFWYLFSNGLLSDPIQRCRDVAFCFEQMPSMPEYVRRGVSGQGTIELDELTGWRKNFNGPAWQAIAEHGANHEDPTRVVWVDQSFSVEHNNGNFINKVKPAGGRRMTIGEDVYRTDHLSVYEYQNDYLRELLDRNHNGEMSYVFGVAAGVDQAFGLGFNFRDAYRSVGEPDGPLMSGRELQPHYRNPIESNDGP